MGHARPGLAFAKRPTRERAGLEQAPTWTAAYVRAAC